MTVFGFSDKEDALFAKKVAQERRSHPVRKTGHEFPERGFNYLRTYIVSPTETIPAATRTVVNGVEKIELGSGICNLYIRKKDEEEDVARRPENNLVSTELIPRLDEESEQVQARVFNPYDEPFYIPDESDDHNRLLITVSDVWGDLYIIKHTDIRPVELDKADLLPDDQDYADGFFLDVPTDVLDTSANEVRVWLPDEFTTWPGILREGEPGQTGAIIWAIFNDRKNRWEVMDGFFYVDCQGEAVDDIPEDGTGTVKIFWSDPTPSPDNMVDSGLEVEAYCWAGEIKAGTKVRVRYQRIEGRWYVRPATQRVPRDVNAADKTIANFGTSGSWQTDGLDLSGILPEGTTAFDYTIRAKSYTASGEAFLIRQSSTKSFNLAGVVTANSNDDVYQSGTINVDSNRLLDYYIDANVDEVDLVVTAYHLH